MAASASASLRRHLLHRSPCFPLSPNPTFRASSFPRRHCRLFASAVDNGDAPSPVEPSDGASVVDVNPPRGTRDFPPEEMRLRNWLFDQFREVSRVMAFEEVDFPVLESEALFIRKAGEEITQQLYNFEDKGGRRVVLRPEITPSLARLVIKQGTMLVI
ncbi:hypothetical protein GUJ93_ZPchr0002g26392 [Zizania palustris]|uniref:histidine--tRNA ligase n=1 Tax=Zizania palustris TaxID=103762 RepID=A0A8J5S2Y1_ZIZPA|nr:hypothetical protein GUJ93_ZPchr0002g26392 [Zizania palustris]